LLKPVKGRVYSLETILEQLELPDGPHLLLTVEVANVAYAGVLQDSHLSTKKLLSVPGLASTRWTYLYTTHEWIPIFKCTESPAAMAAFVDVDCEHSAEPWMTPKGFPREHPDCMPLATATALPQQLADPSGTILGGEVAERAKGQLQFASPKCTHFSSR
jgi:hypothetical protein